MGNEWLTQGINICFLWEFTLWYWLRGIFYCWLLAKLLLNIWHISVSICVIVELRYKSCAENVCIVVPQSIMKLSSSPLNLFWGNMFWMPYFSESHSGRTVSQIWKAVSHSHQFQKTLCFGLQGKFLSYTLTSFIAHNAEPSLKVTGSITLWTLKPNYQALNPSSATHRQYDPWQMA